MTSDNVILVAGGDLRQQYAARRLRQKTGADVWTLGLPAQSGLHSAETLEEVPAYDVLVLPVPASPDGTTVPAPFGKAALPLETLAAHGFHAICFNSETSVIPAKTVRKLVYRFKHIVLLYDTDKTGLECSEKHRAQLSEYGVKRLVLPLPVPASL